MECEGYAESAFPPPIRVGVSDMRSGGYSPSTPGLFLYCGVLFLYTQHTVGDDDNSKRLCSCCMNVHTMFNSMTPYFPFIF